jgi:hypothetical protein
VVKERLPRGVSPDEKPGLMGGVDSHQNPKEVGIKIIIRTGNINHAGITGFFGSD